MAYVNNDEYIAAKGEAETIRLTDEDRAGAVDTAKLEAAILASEEEADAYIGKRYGTPLASAPAFIKSMVIALARERLHGTRPTETVKLEAERARSSLRDIARGLMTIPTANGPAPEDGRPKADSSSSRDGLAPIFTEQNLAGFGVPSGYGVANWRR